MAEIKGIAIIGISGRFPGAGDLEAFWTKLVAGQGAQGGWLDEAECFDPRFFDIPPRQAEWMDPQQRLFLEHCWRALEDAGHLGEASRGKRAGVFVGMSPSDYPSRPQGREAGTPVLSARLSRFLALEGPVLTVDAACASSLGAIHQACRQLRAGLVDLAVAGGVFVMASGRGGALQETADGFLPAEGVGVVVLKPLENALAEGDHVYGVIKGCDMRQEGGASGPALSESRVALIRDAHLQAGVEPETISLVEVHGPGRHRGDALEVDALTRAFQARTERNHFCAVGSVKTHLGHAMAASGIAGVLKLLLSFEHRQLPPSPRFREQLRDLRLEETPFYVNTEPLPWTGSEGQPRRAALSAFSPSGMSCHLVLEEAPPAPPRAGEPGRPAYLFTVSARTQEALARSIANLASALRGAAKRGVELHPGDVAFTLARGREHLELRAAFVATDLQDLVSTLTRFQEKGEAPRALLSGGKSLSSRSRPLFRELTGTLLRELDATSAESTWLEKLTALAELYTLGVDVEGSGLFPEGVYRRVSLPTYPFARERYWIQAGSPSAPAQSPEPPAPVRLPANATLLETVWRADEPRERPPTPEPYGNLLVLVTRETAALACTLLAPWRSVRPFLVVDRVPESPNHPRVDAILDFDSHEAGVRLGQLLNARGGWLAGIVDLSDLRFGGERRGASKVGVLGRLGLLQTLLRRCRSESFPLIHVTRGLRPFAWTGPLDAGGAVMAALVGKLGAEYANLHARTVDVALSEGDADALAEVIRQELTTRDSHGEVLHRQGRRYVPELRPLQGSPGPAPRIFPDKVYVITGGVRGIGLEVARHLVSRGARRLVLMGVQPLPPREQWSELLDDPRTEKSLRERIAPLHALESQDVILRVHTGPLTDEAALEALFRDVRDGLGPIAGCFHSAGVVSFEPPAFTHKPLDTLRRVLEPKVDGLRVLERVLAADALDFFVLFSSVSGVVPALSVGIADYAAANGYMNLLAEQRRAEGRVGYQSIVWPNWKEVGMGEVGSVAYRALGFTAHSTADGLALLDAAMASGCAVPLPAIVEPNRFDAGVLLQLRRQTPARPQVAPSAPVQVQAPAQVQAPVPASEPVRAPEVSVPVAASVSASASPDLGAYALEWLRELFVRELKLPREKLEPHANFSTLGVDSIHIIELMVRMEGWLRMSLEPTLPLLHPTLGELSSHFVATYPEAVRMAFEAEHPGASAPRVLEPAPVVPVPPTQPVQSVPERVSGAPRGLEPIAVIGMACHFPGSPDLEAYWRTLREGRDCISEVPASRWRVEDFHASAHQAGKSISRWGGFIEGIELFDPAYFGISEQDAPCIDPLMRQFLEVSVQCFQHAGHPRSALAGKPVGVFVGSRMSNYAARMPAPTRNGVIGSGQNFIAAHVSHFFDLKGPGVVVDSACSSSLMAVHLACQSLRSGESELALAGGVDILLDESVYLTLSESRALSRDGRCKTFDEKADGFVPGEGAGAVLLKPLSKALADGDRVYAVINGTAVNNDGHTMGITTPDPAGQRAVIQAAHRAGGVEPRTISYVEAHGTGTMIGDPIELRALTEVFSASTDRKGFCAVGSVKSNFGHLLSAAGISGLIKVVLSLMHRELPPTLHCQTPNPRFRFDASPFFPNTALRPWEPLEGVRRAGLSSFGFGGTNAHVVLSEAPVDQKPSRVPLPPVVFARKHYWLEKPVPSERAPRRDGPREAPRVRRPLLALELDASA